MGGKVVRIEGLR